MVCVCWCICVGGWVGACVRACVCVCVHAGPQEIIRVLNTNTYPKLIMTAMRVLKVLSICPKAKRDIVEVGKAVIAPFILTNTRSQASTHCPTTHLHSFINFSRAVGLLQMLPEYIFFTYFLETSC